MKKINGMFEKKDKKVRLYRSKGGNMLTLVFLLLLSAVMILPLLYAILQSLKPIDELFAYPPRFFVRNPTLNNFVLAFKLTDNLSVPFSRYLFNSIFVSVVGTLVYVLISVAAGYSLAKGKFPGNALISNLIVWTMLFSMQVTAIPQYLIISKLRMVDSYTSIILPALAGTMGVFLMQNNVISAIPDAVLEAARLDGSSELQIVTSIVMPNLKPACLTLIIFTFQGMWGNTGATYIYTESKKLLPNVMSTIAAGGIARAGASAAVSVILMLPPILVFLYSQSSVMETMSHSGLK